MPRPTVLAPLLAVTAAALAAPAAAAREAADQTRGPALMSAVVDFNGYLYRGEGAVSSKQTAAGRFEIAFARDVRDCAWVAYPGLPSLGGLLPATMAGTSRKAGSGSTVVVATYDHAGTPASWPFHLFVFCGR